MNDRRYHYDMPAVAGLATEIQIQSACRKRIAAEFNDTLLVAVPNGTHIASHWGRGKARREGLSKGFPDMIAIGPGRVAFIEVKAKSGVKVEQHDWLCQLHSWGHPCGIFRSQDTLADKLREWGFR